MAHFDEHIKLFLDNEDTRFILRQDAHGFHTLGAHCVCSGRFFLTTVHASYLHPDTHGAQLRVMERTKELCGWMGHLVPTDGSLWLTLREDLFTHPVIKQAHLHCKEAAGKVVLAIDGQYSTLMNILYQVPHGSRVSETVGQGRDARVLLLSVGSADSTIHLLVAPNEEIEHQRIALNSAVEDHRPRDTAYSYLTRHSSWMYQPSTRTSGVSSASVATRSTLHCDWRRHRNQKKNRLSKGVRACFSKLRNGYSDNRAYYKRGMANPCHLDFDEAVQRMSDTIASRRVRRIPEDAEYMKAPYRTASELVRDMAALAKSCPKDIVKIAKNKTTVLASLKVSMSAEQLEYLLNHARFISRNQGVPYPMGPLGTRPSTMS